MALLEFAPCFSEIRHSWGCSPGGSPGVSSRCSAHTLPTPGAHGDREAAQLQEKNQENEFFNFFEEDFSSIQKNPKRVGKNGNILTFNKFSYSKGCPSFCPLSRVRTYQPARSWLSCDLVAIRNPTPYMLPAVAKP